MTGRCALRYFHALQLTSESTVGANCLPCTLRSLDCRSFRETFRISVMLRSLRVLLSFSNAGRC